MLPPPTTSRLICFGPFEVDPKSRELFKHGLPIKLQEQPFHILSMLLEHPGELVTREELRQELWPKDTFVDFDQGLNKAINKIRTALGDSAEHPRYIETLNKRGYRLLARLDREGVDPQLSSSVGPADVRREELLGGRASRLWRRVIALWGAPALRSIIFLAGLAGSLPD